MNKFWKLLILFGGLFASCEQQMSFNFKESPAQRLHGKMETLKKTLIQAPYGWTMTYFPEYETKLFNSAQNNLITDDFSIFSILKQENFTSGGFTFLLQFTKDNKVIMSTDFYQNNEQITSNYLIEHGSDIELSFNNRTHIHLLVHPDFKGSSRFIVHQMASDKIILKTVRLKNGFKEYIVLDKNKAKVSLDSYFKTARIFNEMKSPVLTVTDVEGTIVFKSNYDPLALINKVKRYALFVSDHSLSRQIKITDMRGIGSGYSFYENGMLFKKGLSLKEKSVVFNDFHLQNNQKFVSKNKNYTAVIENINF